MIDLIAGVERIKLASMASNMPPPGERADARGAWGGDAAALAAELRGRVAGEVRFDDGARALYATDASNYRQVPIGVVCPRTVEDVIATVAIARKHDAPILARGGGTSLAGQCCNVAVILDFSRHLNRVLEVNVEEKWARVEPGLVLDDLQDATLPHGLRFGPDPATHSRDTLGGIVGNNSCGMHAQIAGKAQENVIELDVLTYDGVRLTVGKTSDDELAALCARTDRVGEIYRGLRAVRDSYGDEVRERFPTLPRKVSGYPLEELLPERGFDVARSLVGTECTLVVVLSAKVRLIPNPDRRVMLVAAYPSVEAAGDAAPLVNSFGPIAVEGFDHRMIDFMERKRVNLVEIPELPWGGGKARGWLMIEFGRWGDVSDTEAAAKACESALRGAGAIDAKVVTSQDEQHDLWLVRESALGASTKVPHHREFHSGWDDSAVPPDALGRYLGDLRALYDKYGYDAAFYGHFGQGCIHCNVDFKLETAAGVAAFDRFMVEAAHLVVSYGGSLSGEHGDGQAHAGLLPIMFGDSLVAAFRDVKRAWDPQGRMNPGKLVDAYPLDSNLREGPTYRPHDPQTYFSFEQDDNGSFAFAANRCVGVGACRQHEGGVMCPSYRVTREEEHSTRGRARLLFEMLEGAPLAGGWQNEAVKDALDLCLACKGCKKQCPVSVDMATYKAEFLAHYFEKKLRPIWAYAFGLIMYWGHLGSKLPRVVNAVTQTPALAALAKAAIRMAPQRRIPPFSEEPFVAWYARHRGASRPNEGARRVILWPDTFNGYFHATTARHALEVLERAGYDVVVPTTTLCCGRPLYDYGMLGLAKLLLRQILDALRADIEAGTIVVALEPSCASVFRDELLNLFPGDLDAQRLAKQVKTFAEFLIDERWSPPVLERKATVHAHCHHASVLGTKPEHELLKRMHVDADWLDDGCCGMAGAFGFERGEHYDVAVAAGELGYVPHVRETGARDFVVTDGFSCREQATQLTDRQALHIADLVWLAQETGPDGPPGDRPEFAAMPNVADQQARARRDLAVGASALGAVLVVAAVAALVSVARRRN